MEKSLALVNTDSFSSYITEINRIPLLTPEEESELAQCYKKKMMSWLTLTVW